MSLMATRDTFSVATLTSDELALACQLAAELINRTRSHNNSRLEETMRYLEQQFRAGKITIQPEPVP